MNIKITGKDLKATEAIKDYIEKKLGRLEKYFETTDELDVQAMIKHCMETVLLSPGRKEKMLS